MHTKIKSKQKFLCCTILHACVLYHIKIQNIKLSKCVGVSMHNSHVGIYVYMWPQMLMYIAKDTIDT